MTKIQFSYGDDIDLDFTPDVGEPLFTNASGEANGRLWVGDGVSPKGIQIGWPFAPNPGWHPSWYYATAPPISAYVTVVATTNFVVYAPIHIGGGVRDAQGASFQSVHAEVTTAQAGRNFRMALYANDGGQPGARLFTSGDISTATTGVKTWSTARTVSGGWYWLAFNTDASTAVFRAADNFGTNGGLLGTSGSPMALASSYYEVSTYSVTPLPTTANVAGSALLDFPAMAMRAAS
jgi:hypothetical protein